MTKLCVDPAGLSFQFAKASSAHPQKLRLIGQVLKYDEFSAHLYVGRVANLPPLHVHISLEDHEQNVERNVCVDLTDVLLLLGTQTTTEGAVVSVWGMYDGKVIRAVECIGVNGQELLGGSVYVLAEISKMNDFL